MSDLQEYKRKRRFDRTPEPEGGAGVETDDKRFVIQKHAASRLHYDFRLEIEGVLKSWAVPKGPSMDPSDKRLAVEVEDHPLAYGDFEGIIPENEYGGGTVMIWDTGIWIPDGNPSQGYRKGHLKFRLRGAKLAGGWTLARMKTSGKETQRNWLLIKRKDDFARNHGDPDILKTHPLSVVSGRDMKEIADAKSRVWSEQTEAAGERVSLPIVSRIAGAKKSRFPGKILPRLPTLTKSPPTGDGWLHEIKYDGYRVIAYKSGEKVRLITRNGKDWTHRFAAIPQAIKTIDVDDLVIDGEMVVLKTDGTTDFQELQNAMSGTDGGRLFFLVFDIIHYNGYDLSAVSLGERKDLLKTVVNASFSNAPIRYSDHIKGKGLDVYRHACRYALEGVVSKRIESGYRQGRTRDWLKTKCLNRQEFVIVGYTDPGGKARVGFGALLLGYYAPGGDLRYAGRVGTGFNERTLRYLADAFKSKERKKSPLTDPSGAGSGRGLHWLKAQMIAEIEFTGWTQEGLLRHPSFKGLREDKDPEEVVIERPADRSSDPGVKAGARQNMPAGENSIAGIRLTNPDRILYPEQGITKEALAEYYERVSDWILPHIVGRPLTIVRCPRGREKKCFYQKHLTDQLPEAVKGVRIKEKTEERIYIMIEDLSGLISLVQLGALELHPWGSRVDKLERPDRMIFDMDPGPGVTPEELVDACRLLRKKLQDIGLESYIKTTGGKGYHLIVPLTRRNDWREVKGFSEAVSQEIVREHPSRFVATMRKDKRGGKVFIDFFRNGRGATSVAAYSTRARPGGPISAPIGWEELSEDLPPEMYRLENLPRRLSTIGEDPWKGFFDIRQSITKAMKKRLKLDV